MDDVKKRKGSSSICIPIVVFGFLLFDVGPVLVRLQARGFAVGPKRVPAVLVEPPNFVGDIFNEGEAGEMVSHASFSLMTSGDSILPSSSSRQ